MKNLINKLIEKCYSHNELERMKSGNSLIQLNSELAV